MGGTEREIGVAGRKEEREMGGRRDKIHETGRGGGKMRKIETCTNEKRREGE